MDPARRTLLRVQLPDRTRDDELEESRRTARLVETLMGKKPELRFQYIQDHARFIDDLDV